jgi:poly(ADP-ribose) glycohydrolase
MILNYFDRIRDESFIFIHLKMFLVPKGFVKFERKCLNEFPDFSKSEKKFISIDVMEKGTIEDSKDALQADFANKYIGGACISYGCVQEEILFSTNPECICSRLFTYIIDNNEALVIKGAEKFSEYKNYAKNLKYGGNFKDDNIDENQMIKTQIVAMDALIFNGMEDSQWKKDLIDRELNKACVAFCKNDLKTISSNKLRI